MAYISFGEWNTNYKYIAITTLFAFLTEFTFGFVYGDDSCLIKLLISNEQFNLSKHIIVHYFFRYLVITILSLILYKYERKINLYNQTDKKSKHSSSIQLIYNNQMKEINYSISTSDVIFVFSLMVIQELLNELYYNSYFNSLDSWMCELPVIAFMTVKILNFKIYAHHKLAIYVNFIIILPIQITLFILNYNFPSNSQCKEFKYNEENIYKVYNDNIWFIPFGIIFYILIMCTRSYSITKIKYYVELKFLSPGQILIVYGIIGTIITLFIGIISSFISCLSFEMGICKVEYEEGIYLENIKQFFEDFKNDVIVELVTIIFGTAFNFLYYYFFLIIIKRLTPMHIIVVNLLIFLSFIISSLFWKPIEKSSYKYKVYIQVIMDSIIFFIILVYLEIIELHFCKLDYNLRKNISIRSIGDLRDIFDEKKENEDDSMIEIGETGINNI